MQWYEIERGKLLIGHNLIKVTVDVYGHPALEGNIEDVDHRMK